MAAGNGDRAVAEIETATAWMASNMQDCSSLSWLLKIVITASSPQAFNKTCNSLQKQLTKAYQVNKLYQHFSSQRQQPRESLPEHLPHWLTAKIRLKTWKGFFQNGKHRNKSYLEVWERKEPSCTGLRAVREQLRAGGFGKGCKRRTCEMPLFRQSNIPQLKQC